MLKFESVRITSGDLDYVSMGIFGGSFGILVTAVASYIWGATDLMALACVALCCLFVMFCIASHQAQLRERTHEYNRYLDHQDLDELKSWLESPDISPDTKPLLVRHIKDRQNSPLAW